MNRIFATGTLLLSSLALGQAVKGNAIDIQSGGKAYASYLAAPATGATKKPAIVLIHSFNGLEQGYKDMTDDLANQGYVTLALGWQTFEKEPSDAVVKQLIEDGLTYLGTRDDVNVQNVGLTGFCAGGRYTMLFLPQLKQFKSGAAWYGFPNQGGTDLKPQKPLDVLGQLSVPMLILHGTKDQASPIAGIYDYAQKLDAAGKFYELNVYQGEPHGFYLRDGLVADTFAAREARDGMLSFFNKTLK